ncbi:MAG: putative 2OG-Fe(II) oxygenase [Gammaproteobacteria bacterium]
MPARPYSAHSRCLSISARQPRSGVLVMFPSYLEHSVGVQRGEQPRVGITFNLDLVDPARVPSQVTPASY